MNGNDTTLNDLLQTNEPGVKLSIFQPTHQASNGPALQEDITRFKNALQAIRADERYDEAGLGKTMHSLDALLEDLEFWKHQGLGLAVFADQNGYKTVSLSTDVTQAYFVGDQYHLSPLVLADSLAAEYYVLDINHTRPRLLEVSNAACTELVIDGMPGSFEDMTDNIEYGKELQHQSGGVGGFHGHTDEAALQDDTHRYYRNICKAVETFLVDHKETLLLMGVQNRVGTLRQMITYPHLLDEYFEGSGEAMNEQHVHEETLPILQKYNSQKRSELIEKYNETDPALTIVGAESIARAADEGRVDTLLLPSFRQTKDTVRDGFEPAIVLQIGTENAELDGLVRSVMNQGGKVCSVDWGSFEDERPRALCRY